MPHETDIMDTDVMDYFAIVGEKTRAESTRWWTSLGFLRSVPESAAGAVTALCHKGR